MPCYIRHARTKGNCTVLSDYEKALMDATRHFGKYFRWKYKRCFAASTVVRVSYRETTDDLSEAYINMPR